MVSQEKSVLVIIDMQKVSLADGFYPVYNIDNLVNKTKKVIDVCRQANFPVVFTRHIYRVSGIDAVPLEFQGAGFPVCAKGSVSAEIIDELKFEPQDIVVDKSRWNAFYGSDLKIVLKGLGVRNLIFCGVFTDACVRETVFDAFYRGFSIVLIKDCCGCHNSDIHKANVLDMANWVYGITIFSADEFAKYSKGENYKAWQWKKPNSVPYTKSTLDRLYDSL